MFEGLLLRFACSSWIIVTCYSLTHTDDTVVSVFCPILFAVTLCVLSFRKKKIRIFINSVTALLFVFYIRSGYTRHGSFINILYPDIFVASINWRNTCRHVLNELLLITGYVRYYAHVFIKRYGRWRIACYFIACLLLTFLFPYIVNLCCKLPVRLTVRQIIKNEWFGKQIFESGDDVLFDYRQSRYLTNLSLEYVGTRDTYKLHLEYIHVSKSYISFLDEQALPICRQEFFRHVGEDIRLECMFRFQNIRAFPKPPYLTKPKFYWMKGTSKLNISDRLHVDMFPEAIRGNYSRWFRNKLYYIVIEIRLDIHIIKRNDFGEYQLWVSFLSTDEYNSEKLICNKFVRYTNIQRHKIILAKFILTKLKSNVQHLKVPVGRMVHLNTLVYCSLADNEDLSFFYKIDSVAVNKSGDTGDLCPALFKGCGFFMYSYFELSGMHLIFKNDTDIVVRRIDYTTFVLDVMSCICPSAYGEHSIMIYREFYNKTLKKRVIVEIPYHSKFIILPTESFISTQNYSSELYEETLFMLQNDETDKWKHIWKHHIPGEETVYRIKFLIECILYGFLWAFIVVTNMLQWTLLVRVMLPRIQLLLEGNESCNHFEVRLKKPVTTVYDLVPNHHNHILHDVLIINAEEDSAFVLNELLPFLEKRGLNVCAPDTDFTAGERLLKLYYTAVRQSRLYVTICSESLVDSPILNQYVSDVVITELFENRAYKKSLFLKYGECEIPEALLMFSDLIDWTSQIETAIKFKRLSNWLTKNYRN